MLMQLIQNVEFFKQCTAEAQRQLARKVMIYLAPVLWPFETLADVDVLPCAGVVSSSYREQHYHGTRGTRNKLFCSLGGHL